jgi:hypothetical protein
VSRTAVNRKLQLDVEQFGVDDARGLLRPGEPGKAGTEDQAQCEAGKNPVH